jgi:hypothetical protein
MGGFERICMAGPSIPWQSQLTSGVQDICATGGRRRSHLDVRKEALIREVLFFSD